MNKKQLIAAWISVFLVCLIVLSAPKKYVRHLSEGRIFVSDRASEFSTPEIQWGFVIQRSLVVLLIGGILLFTFQDPKK